MSEEQKGHWKDCEGNEYSMDDCSDREEIVRQEFDNNNLDGEFAAYLENECIDWTDEFIQNCGDLQSRWESERDAFIEHHAREVFEDNIGRNFYLGDTKLEWVADEPEVKKVRSVILLVELDTHEENTKFDEVVKNAILNGGTTPYKLDVRVLTDRTDEVKTEDKE